MAIIAEPSLPAAILTSPCIAKQLVDRNAFVLGAVAVFPSQLADISPIEPLLACLISCVVSQVAV